MTAEGRLEEAYELASATNNMPEICGRICPQDRLCEGNCVIEKGFESVTIGAVEKHITDTAFEMGWVKPPRPRRERAESVGVIGAGPGRARRRRAAAQARLPGPRLRPLRPGRRPADLRHPQLQAGEGGRRAPHAPARATAASQFHLDWRGRRASSASPSCAQRHDALFVGTGVYRARDIAMPGVGLAQHRAGARLSDREQPQGPGRPGAGVRLRRAQRRRQARRGDRRRRHRDGLRAHRGPPGRRLGDRASTGATAPTCRARCAR